MIVMAKDSGLRRIVHREKLLSLLFLILYTNLTLKMYTLAQIASLAGGELVGQTAVCRWHLAPSADNPPPVAQRNRVAWVL